MRNCFLGGREGDSKLEIQDGGANRNRTDDLLNAIQALSQLSYAPHGFPSADALSGWGLPLAARKRILGAPESQSLGRETPGRLAEQLHAGRGFSVLCLDLAGPEASVYSNRARQCQFRFQSLTL